MNPMVKAEIKAVLNHFHEPGYYAGDIPKKVARHIRSAFHLPPDEELFALLDLSIFRKGRSGLLFTEKGVYWKYALDSATLSWERLSVIQTIKPIDPNKLQLDERQTITINREPTPEQVATMLRELRDIVRRHDFAASLVEETPEGAAPGTGALDALSRDAMIRKVVLTMCPGAFLPPFEGKIKSRLEERFLIPDDDKALAYLDFGIFSQGKEGIILSSKGIYWRSKLRTRCYTWEDLYAAPLITLPDKNELAIDGQKLPFIASSGNLNNDVIRDILEKIISYRPKDREYVPPVLPLDYSSALRAEDKLLTYDRHVIGNIASKRTTPDLSFKLVPMKQAVTEEDKAIAEQDEEIIEPDEDVVASTSDSLDRFSKGVTLSNLGVSLYHSVYSNSARESSFIPYARLARAELHLEAHERLYVDSWLINESSTATDIYNLLLDLQAYAQSLLAEDAPEIYGNEALYMDVWPIPVTGSIKAARWVVAEDKVIRGVWDEFELRHGLENGLLPSDNLDVWTEGMERWVPIQESGLASSI